MHETPSFTVETSSPTCLILGDRSWLVESLIHELTDLGLKLYTQFSALPPNTSPDYCLLLQEASFSLGEQQLLSSSRLFEVIHHSRVGDPPPIASAVRLIYADTFGPHFTHAPTLTSLLTKAHHDHSLTIPGDGVDEYHLLTEGSLLTGIVNAVTSPHPARTIYLVSPSGFSLLSLAYLIRANFPGNLSLSFNPAAHFADFPYDWSQVASSQSSINWSPENDLTTPLSTYLQQFVPAPSPAPARLPPSQESPSAPPRLKPLFKPSDRAPAKLAPSPANFVPIKSPRRLPLPKLRLPPFSVNKSRSRLHLPRPLSIVVAGLFVALALYSLLLISSITLTYLTLRSYPDTLSSGHLPPKSLLTTARPPAIFLEANLVALAHLPGISPSSSLAQLTGLLTSYRQSLDSLILAHNLADTSSHLLDYLFGQADHDPTVLINRAQLESSELYESLSLLSASLPPDPPSLIPGSYSAPYQTLHTALNEFRGHTLTAKALLSIAPDLLGVGERRKYLVLFQNNMELRATGGFIGSFALMSLENGKLYDFVVHDVYSADGQLKGHVEPPWPIKEYLGEANWYMRDSNWDPDFPTSARRAEWFLDKTMQLEVDGTIGLNVYTLAELLRALGPINIPDYNEEINADNVFERAEYHSEVNFFPGSTQKKEFLSSVADSLFQSLENLSVEEALPIARALAKSIDEKNTTIALSSENTNRALSALGWNGELRSPPCPDLGGECYSDYLMLVDSNFGVNKANYFLRRQLSLTLTIDANRRVEHTLLASYQNIATSGSWPAGPYKSYSRLYLPLGAQVQSLQLDGELVPSSELDISVEHNRTVVGYLLQVPVSTTVALEITYTLPSQLAASSPVYSLYWQKQPGTSHDPLDIYLNYPLFLKPLVISPQAKLNQNQLEFNLTNITDRRITVKFQ